MAMSGLITSDILIDFENNFKVEAGPGAGKTHFLSNNIKNIVQNSKRLSQSRKVACITYTNTAVEILLKKLGRNISDRVEVSTIHSFLYKNIIKPYLSFIADEYEVKYQKVKGHDEFEIKRDYIKKWFESEIFKTLETPSKQHDSKNQLLKMPEYRKALGNWLLSMKCIIDEGNIKYECDNRKAKTENIGLKKKTLTLLSKGLIDLKKIYWKEGMLSHEDVLFFSYLLIIKYPFILDILRAKYPYLLIDEYQDTNPIQSFIIDKIKEEECIIGVVGDKAQSIYSFQGANPELFDSFICNEIYTITDNRRSSNQIIKFLNELRKDITQTSPEAEKKNDINVKIVIGERTEIFKEMKKEYGNVASLSRDNILSNSMKKEFETSIKENLIKVLRKTDNNSKRKNYIITSIEAIEVAKNGNYKESIKKLERIFENEIENDSENNKKKAVKFLIEMLSSYDDYKNSPLMDLYDKIKKEFNLSGFKQGNIKDFYDNNIYNSVSLGINIKEDKSNHITIHKAKGEEYDNVFINGNKSCLDFLLKSNLEKNEEHRVMYVAMSRACKKLIIHFETLELDEEKELRKKYPTIDIKNYN